jgi:ketosteroid isomerase-like protein
MAISAAARRARAAKRPVGYSRGVSEDNVEIVRGVYDAAARRDSAAVLAAYHPEIELDASRIALGGLMGQPVRRGHEGARSFFRDIHDAWQHLGYDLSELIDAGEERVVSVVTRRGRGRTSGIEVGVTVALVWTLSGGKVTRIVWFATREEALEAAKRT